jgi:hypothetical protein
MLSFGWGPKFKHRTFDYTPRFYDPEKEAFQERLRMLEEKYGEKTDHNAEKMKFRIRQGLRSKQHVDPGVRKQAARTAALRRMVLVGILLILVFIILQSDKIEKFLYLINK